MSQELKKNIFNIPYEELTIKLDQETIKYLKDEAKKTDLRPEIIATSFLRNAAFEHKHMNI